MKPHVERMQVEAAELFDKTSKLAAFIAESPIFKTLPAEEQYDMNLQLEAMSLYGRILKHRLDRALAAD